jgi:hypothetical protein
MGDCLLGLEQSVFPVDYKEKLLSLFIQDILKTTGIQD